jgi:hypothetical protein
VRWVTRCPYQVRSRAGVDGLWLPKDRGLSQLRIAARWCVYAIAQDVHDTTPITLYPVWVLAYRN